MVTTTRGAHPALARVINDRVTLDLIAARGPVSRSVIKAAVGISHPTMLDVIGRLQEARLIQPAGEGGLTRRGPNAQLYDITRHAAAVGVRVDGEHIHAVVTDLRGNMLGEHQRPVHAAEPAQQIAAVVRAAGKTAAKTIGVRPPLFSQTRDTPAGDRLVLGAAVVGMHGLVDPDDGDLGFAWDLPDWRHRVTGALRSLLPCTFRLERDVMLAAVAERELGAALKRDDFAVVWMGTGIGCAMFIGGHPIRGASGGAGQIGYLPVPGVPILPLTPTPGSGEGFHGGLQALIGAEAIQHLAVQHGEARASAAESLASASPQLINAVAARVAMGLASICTVVDPGHVVLSGDVGRAGGVALAQAVEEALLSGICPTPVTVTCTSLNEDAIIAGAVRSAVGDARDVLWGRFQVRAPREA